MEERNYNRVGKEHGYEAVVPSCTEFFFVALRRRPDGAGAAGSRKKLLKASLGERLELEDADRVKGPVSGARQMTFQLSESRRVVESRRHDEEHREERRQIHRPAHGVGTRVPGTPQCVP